jgi:hypothetical protein
MKNYSNIKKSTFRNGEYVGYGGGTVWRIFRYTSKSWQASAKDFSPLRRNYIVSGTLFQMSAVLDKLSCDKYRMVQS